MMLSNSLEWLLPVADDLTRFAATWFLQSTLLLTIGLLVARCVRRYGSACQSVVLRTTLVASLLCPLAALLPASLRVSGWQLTVPTTVSTESPSDVAANYGALPTVVSPTSPVESQTLTPLEPLAAIQTNGELTVPNHTYPLVRQLPPAATDTQERATVYAPSSTSVAATSPSFDTRFVAPGLVAVWMAVMMTLVVRLAFSLKRVGRLVRSARQADPAVVSVANDIAGRMGTSLPQLVVSPLVTSPCLVGMLKPTVILPEDFAELPLRGVLVHELAHLKRRDCWWLLVRKLAECVFFFQPLLWLLGRRADELAEDVCDDFVVQYGSSPTDFAEGLLNVAALSVSPSPVPAVAMVSGRSLLKRRISRLLDSSRELSTRVKRIALLAIIAGGLTGTVIAGSLCIVSASAAAKEVDGETPQETPDDNKKADDQEQPVLSGRIVDDTGAPVTDAQLTLQGPAYLKTQTDADGRYSFETVDKPGSFRIGIKSAGWVGLTDYSQLPKLQLTPQSKVTKDFTLPKAAQLQIRAVDEEGLPVRDVSIYVASLADVDYRNTDGSSTDGTGWAIVGGLKPQAAKYIIGLQHKDYAFEKLIRKIDNAETSDILTITMREGQTVSGNAICSDGKPPAGWRILAMPTWWHYGISPRGPEINEDGSFELKHIVPGEYKVTISVPSGRGGSMPKQVLTGDLLKEKQPLAVTMDYPSPSSMVSIAGTVEVIGKSPQSFWLFATSEDRKFRSSFVVRKGKTEFKIGPIPKGVYEIKTEDAELENVTIKAKAPAKDVRITVKSKVNKKPKLAGQVLLPDGKTPVTHFELSVMKLRTLSGPHYVQDARWQGLQNKNGEFSLDVNSPGIYRVAALADGFAPTTSEPFNTTEDSAPIVIKLDKGVSLSGTVVDPAGKPVSSALVQPFSMASKSPNGSSFYFLSPKGAVKTDAQGLFTLPHLPSKDKLQVSAKGFTPTKTEELDLSKPMAEPLKLVLRTGGSIRGLAFDGDGKRASGRILHFQDRYYGSDYERGRLASASANDTGFYEVDHLPIQPVTITCGDEWRGTGVVRRTVLPRDGEKLTVMFGGSKAMTGTMKINGKPLSNGRVMLTGEYPNGGIMKALAKTDAQGTFRFFGPPPGLWTLYYDSSDNQRAKWLSVRQLEIGTSVEEIGEMDFVTGKLTFECEPKGADMSAWRFQLAKGTGDGPSVGRPPMPNQGQIVFDNIPQGEYELLCFTNSGVGIRQRVLVTKKTYDQPIKLKLPTEFASISATVEESIVSDNSYVRLTGIDPNRSKPFDSTEKKSGVLPINAYGYAMQAQLQLKDGKFKVDKLPPGRWFINQAPNGSESLYSFEVRAGENKNLALTKANVTSPKLGAAKADKPLGFCVITVYTTDGAVTPCNVTLKSPAGKTIKPNAIQQGTVQYRPTPGDYEATVSLKGYQTQKRTINIPPVNKEGRATGNWQVAIMLERDANK